MTGPPMFDVDEMDLDGFHFITCGGLNNNIDVSFTKIKVDQLFVLVGNFGK
jgi:hypothetical protein